MMANPELIRRYDQLVSKQLLIYTSSFQTKAVTVHSVYVCVHPMSVSPTLTPF